MTPSHTALSGFLHKMSIISSPSATEPRHRATFRVLSRAAWTELINIAAYGIKRKFRSRLVFAKLRILRYGILRTSERWASFYLWSSSHSIATVECSIYMLENISLIFDITRFGHNNIAAELGALVSLTYRWPTIRMAYRQRDHKSCAQEINWLYVWALAN